ncbi:uncharacterized protein Dmoj_GI19878, partial [Drosophila mojavensis]
MAGYRALPLAPVTPTAAAAAVQPSSTMAYAHAHHQSLTAMSNNGIIYQSAVHASIHSLNTVQSQHLQRSSTTHHHILATATATAT